MALVKAVEWSQEGGWRVTYFDPKTIEWREHPVPDDVGRRVQDAIRQELAKYEPIPAGAIAQGIRRPPRSIELDLGDVGL